MPSTRPSTMIWNEMASAIGCDTATIKAVFEVEAAGKFYESNGSLPRRFEPHHFPRKHWGAIGFNPGNQKPWRASLKIRTSTRRAMFDRAEIIDAEATYKATSYGAPQIMGFNHTLAGYASAADMVDAFEQSADEQIRAFVTFCKNAGLVTHLRSQDWHSFASGYNGSGQAAVYAAKIETAYRRQSGGFASATVIRVGMQSAAVEELQHQLAELGYEIAVDGHFGNETLRAVKDFQRRHDLKVDGMVGATTQRVLVEAGASVMGREKGDKPTTSGEITVDKLIERGTAVVGAGGISSLLAGLDETAQQILMAGLVLGAVAIAVLFITKKRKS